MTEPFLAEIRMFAGHFAPQGWAFCNGQILPIRQNNALFSLLGTTYGGDGKSTFALPNLQVRIPIHPGQGPGLSNYSLGQSSGQTTVTLLTTEIPSHTHTLQGTGAGADRGDPTQAMFASARTEVYGPQIGSSPQMNPNVLGQVGQNQPHNNLQPYLAVNFIIALQGIFPQRP
ncbi:MAG: tail fiber protein [Nostoc sp. DedQUE12a]|nr:tail fiber protein [Nostoc sp. DedQUE12a]